jgi:predicted flap endonuclease-1-like 5' DNA nuclease
VAGRKVAQGGPADDLKRIRGIGVLIERRLNALGVTHYEDIANWTADDIDRISHQLDFKGRIQREGWVEQARILAAGGDTEFSRRLDRRDGDGRSKS